MLPELMLPMKRVATTLTFAVLAATAAATPAHAASPCTARGAKTVAQNAEARVFYVKKAKGATKRVYYGCQLTRKPRRLAANVDPKSSEETHVSNVRFRLAGTFVAWVQTASSDFGVGEFGREIVVRSLRSGGRQLDQGISDYNSVTGLAIRADGAVAWMLAADRDYTEVDGVQPGETKAIPFAYARGIARNSLVLDDTSVHWIQDGAERSGELR
jgi:hypothetical protein